MHGIALHEAALDSEMPIISDKENVIVAPGQEAHQYHCCMMTRVKN